MHPVTVLIPAFNEEKGIGAVVDAVRALKLHGEVLVVDDGSTDKTAEVAREHGARVIRRAGNAGYGRTLKDGIAAAAHETIVVTDADGTYPVDKIPELLEVFSGGYEMVVGARQGSAYRGTFLKMPARIVFKFLAEFATGRRIPDINSGLRVFNKSDAMRCFPDLCNGFSFTTTITLVYMLTGRTVGYVPVPYYHRVGRSKVKIIRDSLRTLQYLTEAIVRHNPIKFFLLLSILTFLGSCVFTVFLGLAALFEGFLASAIVFALGLVAEAARRPREW
jgi:glycosyltransferase involved in cell wall biosynthesis